MMADLEQRIAAWLDGRISEAESETLQQELLDSAEARTAFRLYAELDAVIRETADTQGVGTISNAAGRGSRVAAAGIWVSIAARVSGVTSRPLGTRLT